MLELRHSAVVEGVSQHSDDCQLYVVVIFTIYIEMTGYVTTQLSKLLCHL